MQDYGLLLDCFLTILSYYDALLQFGKKSTLLAANQFIVDIYCVYTLRSDV